VIVRLGDRKLCDFMKKLSTTPKNPVIVRSSGWRALPRVLLRVRMETPGGMIY
jgi:hypothetical protein